MNFLEAFEHMKSGGTVKRLSATEKGNEVMETYIDDANDDFLYVSQNGSDIVYLTPSDIDALDWEIVE